MESISASLGYEMESAEDTISESECCMVDGSCSDQSNFEVAKQVFQEASSGKGEEGSCTSSFSAGGGQTLL